MILVSVLYPAAEGTKFDLDYYMSNHIPLLKDRWTKYGLQKIEVAKGVGKPDGTGPAYQMMAHLTFDSMENFQAAGAAHAPEVFADIPKFTDAAPTVQINQILS